MKESYKDNGTFKNGFLGRPFSVIIGLLLVAAGLAASFIIIANFDIFVPLRSKPWHCLYRLHQLPSAFSFSE